MGTVSASWAVVADPVPEAAKLRVYVRISPAAAVDRSTCFVTVKAMGADETFSTSRNKALTAGSNRLVPVTVIVSLRPALPAAGIATWTSSDAAPPGASGTGAVSTESPPSRTPLPFTSRYTVTGQLWTG